MELVSSFHKFKYFSHIDLSFMMKPHRKLHQRKPTQHTSIQHQFKTGLPQGGILLPTLFNFNIYTADIPTPILPVQVKAYADDMTITYTHTSTSAAKKYIQPYLHKVFVWTKQNNLTLDPDKTTCTLFTYKAVMGLALEYSSSIWSH